MKKTKRPFTKNGRKRFRILTVLFVIVIMLTTSYLLKEPAFAQNETGDEGLPGIALSEEPPEYAEVLETAPFGEEDVPAETGSADGTGGSAEETENPWAADPEGADPLEEAVDVAVFTEESGDGRKGNTVIESISATVDGISYVVTVTCDSEAGIPAGSQLQVSELTEDNTEYESYLTQTAEALNSEASDLSYIKLLDISVVDENGNKITPSAPVDVQIRLPDHEEISEAAQIIHFGEEVEILDSSVDGDTVSFETRGFSAYAIVEGPGAVPLGWHKVESVDELGSADGFYIGHTSGYYFTDRITQINSSRTGITKTKPAQDYPPEGSAVKYYFEKVEGTEDQFKVYCKSGDVRKYIVQSANSLNLTQAVGEATVFTIENVSSSEIFRARGNDGYYWNMQGGANGASFAAYQDAGDTNARFHFWYFDEIDEEPYGLDGKTYGLMNWNGGVAGKALMGTSSKAGALDAKPLTVMSKEGNHNDHLFAPNESDISMWTFHWIEDDFYYLTTVVDGSTKYLRIDENGISAVSEVDESCRIQVVPGAGSYKGQIHLKSGDTTLVYSGKVENGFSTSGSVGNEWLKLVEEADLTTDYYMTDVAKKVSISAVPNGAQVIVYTRAWNETEKHYEYFAIRPDGSLEPVSESGDTIEWKSGQLNELLWEFTEYYWEGTSDPNYYYELYNPYSGKYIAPQVTGGQIVADNKIGINLNGRRDGQYYSPILAWDEQYYSFVGLKVKNGQIVSCPKTEAMDFYFAVMDEQNVDDTPNTVETVDHTQYGITMKIIDLENTQNANGYMNAFIGNNDGGLGRVLKQGLLSDQLGADDYPTTTITHKSLGEMYTGAKEVNHLFIQGAYDETGYFTYDSTQNFATLRDPATGQITNNFTVYKELGTHDASNKNTLKHGQFFPFNDLKPGEFASLNGQNLYTFDEEHYELLLPDSDPRKYEQMYDIEHTNDPVDYYFAVELEASFTQTESGEDAWGHDIIFEFTGDDDFWLYVDGELVIDLGGIHSSVPGSVNFKTGQVKVNGEETTLRAIFEKHYRDNNPDATDAQVTEYLNSKFKENTSVFKDFSNHTMRIFYMERGASASNLQMRFNLAAVKKGTVELEKQLGNVDDPELVMAEFPYQIFYKTQDGTVHRLTNHIPDTPQNDDYVFYKDSIKPVKYLQSKEIAGITYQDVFFLKPGEVAQISFPKDMVSYEIVECGINTDVYSDVRVNGASIYGNGTSGEGYQANRKDFPTGWDTTDNRAKVSYVNNVNENAIRNLTITKKLFEEDGETPISYPEDQTTFSFRLYMAPEFETLDTVNMHTYYVKDGDGNYCTWDAEGQRFQSLGKSDFSDLTADEKAAAIFTTSIYGSISRIPADYTVEIRNILAGTQFRVQERPWEIPDGYSFQKYIYNGEDSPNTAEKGITDVVEAGVDPAVIVNNLKGWGLRMNKTWSDDGYMSSRKAAYFAVYIAGGEGSPRYVDNTLRQLKFDTNPQTLYWYFEHLETGIPLNQYQIREVDITSISEPLEIDSDGYVINDEAATFVRIEDGGEIYLTGTQKGETEESAFKYTVNYTQGEITEGSNVRIDKVENYRPGILLKKTKWDGSSPLAGAHFTLQDGDNVIGTFTSDESGLITTAFLRNGASYTLIETGTPQSWYGLQAPLTITVSNGVIMVGDDADPSYYVVDNTSSPHSLTVKNRPYEFKAVKIDQDTKEVMQGVTFALHRQVTVGDVTTIDLNPMPGYETLVTDANGVIPDIDNTLPPGTYQLREKATLPGYVMTGYVMFTVSETGMITLGTSPEGTSLEGPTEVQAEDGRVSFVLTIPNKRPVNILLKKEDDKGNPLTGSKFRLSKFGTSWKDVPGYETIDLTEKTEETIKNLGAGLYRLTETTSPDGYVLLTKDIYFRIDFDSNGNAVVTLTDEAGTGENTNHHVSVDGKTITVTNIPGVELPKTGGIGTLPFTIGGSALILAALALLAIYKFKKREREIKS